MVVTVEWVVNGNGEEHTALEECQWMIYEIDIVEGEQVEDFAQKQLIAANVEAQERR